MKIYVSEDNICKTCWREQTKEICTFLFIFTIESTRLFLLYIKDQANTDTWICNLCYCCCLPTQLYPTLCDSMDCSPPGFSVHGISQARILEWVASSFCKATLVKTTISYWHLSHENFSLLLDQLYIQYLRRLDYH